MALTTLWRATVGVEHTAIENVRFDVGEETGATSLVVSVRPFARRRGRCGRCRRRSPGYDAGGGRRRWRAPDHGLLRCFLEADAPRVKCREHGVVVAHVPWAAHGAGHTHAFDAQVAWLATKMSKSAASELMRIAWPTVGAVLTRVYNAAQATAAAAGNDGLDELRRIGIDEVSYKRGRKYLTVVVDHDTGLLVWAGEGHTRATLAEFFDALGPTRSADLTHVSADGAPYIEHEVTARCPEVVIGIDPFHVVKWANDTLARVRVDAWNAARKMKRFDPPAAVGGARQHQWLPGRDTAKALRGSRYALMKNPDDLTEKQQAKLAWIQVHTPDLYRAYQLKETLRAIFTLPVHDARLALDRWLNWAQRCRIAAFVALGRKIRKHRHRILLAIEHQLSNGRVESVNNKIRVMTRIAYGFHNAHALIALAMLALGRHQPALPGRS